MGAKGMAKGVRYDDILLKSYHTRYLVETINELKDDPGEAAFIKQLTDCGVSKVILKYLSIKVVSIK